MIARSSRLLAVVLAPAAALAACAADPTSDVPAGYVRFEPPPITIQPGESGQWVQYIAGAADQDLDVIDIIGTQGPGGHHAVLYSSPRLEPVGTTRPWETSDQIADRFLGGIGGEGAEDITLPEGAVFRIPAGHALYLNVHYFNATPSPLEGWSRLDVKLEPASPDRTAVGMFGHTDLNLRVPAGEEYTVDVTCEIEEPLDLIMYANHMHEWGVAVRTSMVVDGVETVIKDDPAWQYEWATNPNFTRHAMSAPLRIPAGARLTTTCTWDNATERPLTFPDEMCVFIGFHPAGGDRGCNAGE